MNTIAEATIKPEPRLKKGCLRFHCIIEGEGGELPNYYATLGISSFRNGLKELKRLGLHPSRFIKPDMSESKNAKLHKSDTAVGQATDVLTDGELGSRYDKKLVHQ